MPERLRGFTTRCYINPLYLCLYTAKLLIKPPPALHDSDVRLFVSLFVCLSPKTRVAAGARAGHTGVGHESGPSRGRVVSGRFGRLGHKILRLGWVGLDRVQCQTYLINIQFTGKKRLFDDYNL